MTDDYLDPNTEREIHNTPVPFAGRQPVFARIQQYLIDPSDRHALLFIGRQSIGKSAILLQCQQVFGDNVIGCYLPLVTVHFTDEANWLAYLVHQTNGALDRHHLNITRLPDLPEAPDAYRQWLTDSYLPELSKLIRPHRRLVWLMDDIEHLIDAISGGQLPDDTVAYLYQLLQTHLQLGIVMTLDEDKEARATRLAPWIDMNRLQRLHSLSAEETTDLMSRFVPQITDDACAAIYDLTDGQPLFLQYVGEALQPLAMAEITETEVKQVADIVYTRVNEIYRHIWQNTLSQNERLVLTAISGLLYDDPLGNLTTQRIESWLLETDFPLDITSINAGIRGLEYQHLVVGSTSDGIRIRARLFQRWLIEHARLDKPATLPARLNTDDDSLQIGRRGLLVIIAIVIVIILLVAVVQQSTSPSSTPLQPTVTLGSE